MALQYSAFGLSLSANQPIPGLAPVAATSEVDTRIRLGALPDMPAADGSGAGPGELRHATPGAVDGGLPALTAWTVASGDFWRLRYADGTEFVVDRHGRDVWVAWPASLTVEDTATYLLGPVLGLVLRLRGVTCLHASAVAVGDRALVLVGPASAGKSTAAAGLARAGCAVLSDDAVPLVERDGVFLAQPAYPHLRLWPDSAAAIYGSAEALPRLTPTWDKRYVDLTAGGHRFERRALPIGGLYLLDERCAGRGVAPFEPVTGHRAVLTLVANTYVNYLPGPDATGGELERLHRLLMSVPLRRVRPPADPARLPELCRALVDDLRARGGAAVPRAPGASSEYVQR
jgi:hypothetical protein